MPPRDRLESIDLRPFVRSDAERRIADKLWEGTRSVDEGFAELHTTKAEFNLIWRRLKQRAAGEAKLLPGDVVTLVKPLSGERHKGRVLRELTTPERVGIGLVEPGYTTPAHPDEPPQLVEGYVWLKTRRGKTWHATTSLRLELTHEEWERRYGVKSNRSAGVAAVSDDGGVAVGEPAAGATA